MSDGYILATVVISGYMLFAIVRVVMEGRTAQRKLELELFDKQHGQPRPGKLRAVDEVGNGKDPTP